MAAEHLCPEKTTLAEYLLGKLDEPELGQCESHLAVCPACEDTIRGLNASDTLSQLTSSFFSDRAEPTDDDRQLVENLIVQLQNAPPPKPSAVEQMENRAAEVTRLLAPAESATSIGRLAHYEIEELIGAGSTGVVYRALDTQLHRTVALKVLRPSLGETSRDRFMAEARAAAGITHPGVVTIYEVGDSETLAYLAMQWVAGETLEQRLDRATFLPESDVRRFGLQIANGLKAAHACNLIHRDIKPANIWIDEADEHAIILDFGLARIADDDPHMTATGMLAGTPNFMSPEQTRGLELDGRSDLFSLGCLMYRASTGKLPFGSTGILATLQSIQNDAPRSPREMNPNLTNELSDLVMCLLEKQPADRPANAAQLIAALESPQSDWPFSADEMPAREIKNRPAAPTQTNPEFQKPGWSIWIAAALLPLAIGFAGLMWGEQIIRIATNQGELVIESSDENVEIEILRSGEVVKVVDATTLQKIDIVAGEYSFRVTDPRNDFEVTPNSLVMSRGGEQIVRITKRDVEETLDAQTDVRADPNALAETTPSQTELTTNDLQPRYDGRTFDEWLNILNTERSYKSIIDAMFALGSLSAEDNERQDELITVLTPIVREHGSRYLVGLQNPNMNRMNYDSSHINDGLLLALSFIDKDRLMDFVIEEIRNGTKQSRDFLIFTLITGSISEGDLQAQYQHFIAIENRSEDIAAALLKAISGGDSDNSSELLNTLISTLANGSAEPDANGNFTSQLGAKSPEQFRSAYPALARQFAEAFASGDTAVATAMAPAMAVFIDPHVAGFAERIGETFADPSAELEVRVNAYITLAIMTTEGNAGCIPYLLMVATRSESENSGLEKRLSGPINNGFHSTAFTNSVNADSFEYRLPLSVRIAFVIGRFGKDAEAALPWLESLLPEEYYEKAVVDSALEAIRGPDTERLNAIVKSVGEYTADHGQLPFVANQFHSPELSWMVRVVFDWEPNDFKGDLRAIDADGPDELEIRAEIGRNVNLKAGLEDPSNQPIRTIVPGEFVNHENRCEFFFVGAFDKAFELSDVTDGTESTIMLVAGPDHDLGWYQPHTVSIWEAVDLICNKPAGEFTTVAFYDGSIARISRDAGRLQITELMTPDGDKDESKKIVEQSINDKTLVRE